MTYRQYYNIPHQRGAHVTLSIHSLLETWSVIRFVQYWLIKQSKNSFKQFVFRQQPCRLSMVINWLQRVPIQCFITKPARGNSHFSTMDFCMSQRLKRQCFHLLAFHIFSSERGNLFVVHFITHAANSGCKYCFFKSSLHSRFNTKQVLHLQQASKYYNLVRAQHLGPPNFSKQACHQKKKYPPRIKHSQANNESYARVFRHANYFRTPLNSSQNDKIK